MKQILLFTILFISFGLQSQDSRLANEYYNSGEYEKAAIIYKKLYDDKGNNHYYFEQYVNALLAVEAFDEVESAIKSQLKKKPKNMELYVAYGNLLERQYKPEEANTMYRKGIDQMPNDISVINKLGNSFTRLTKYDLALETYLKAESVTGNGKIFVNNIADLYKRKGNAPKMIEYYIKYASYYPDQISRTKTNFQRYLNSDEDLAEMKTQLYTLIQEDQESIVYPELLQWVFVEQKDFKSALRQARALDRRIGEDGKRVVDLANIAMNTGDLESTIKAYDYILEKGPSNPYFVTAKSMMLKCERELILENKDYLISDLDTLDSEYLAFIEEMGINSQTEYLVKEYADFLALYKNDLPGAIKVLDDLVSLSSIKRTTKANAKIALADYNLMLGDIWEATLLYSQVEKDFKEEHLGEVSRFKNAMLAYYAGEFAWAQEQFDILESATSRLISNDAIDMSVFIMDNMGLDTTDVPIKMFAQAELLTVQNKFDEAFVMLKEINEAFPKHALEDDIIYQQAQIYQNQRKYDEALDLYKIVFTDYVEEIRADNALWQSAEIYEYNKGEVEKAKELYEKLFIDFSNSTFAIEARKRFRILRGDDI